MAENQRQTNSASISVPVGLIATALVLLVGGAIYMLVEKPGAGMPEAPNPKGVARRVGLLALASAIENDISRRALVAVIRAVARRA